MMTFGSSRHELANTVLTLALLVIMSSTSLSPAAFEVFYDHKPVSASIRMAVSVAQDPPASKLSTGATTLGPNSTRLSQPHPSVRTQTGTGSSVLRTLVLANDTLIPGNFLPAGALGPLALATDPSNGNIYVANFVSNDVTVIDGSNDAVVGSIAVGLGPIGMAVDPYSQNIFVSNYSTEGCAPVCDGTVSIINSSTGAAIPDTGPFSYASGMAYDSANGNIYVATDSPQELIAIVNGSTGQSVGAVNWTAWMSSTPGVQVQIAIDSLDGTIYLAGDDSNFVAVVNATTYQVVGQVAVGQAPEGIAFDPTNGCIYVANSGGENLTVIDGKTNLVTASIRVGVNPVSVAVDSNNDYIYASNSQSDNVSVIDGQSNRVVGNLTVGSDPFGLALDGANGLVYVANRESDNVTVIDPSFNQVVTSIELMPEPERVAFDTWNGDLYVTDFRTNQVMVLSGQTDTIIARVNVGLEPLGIAFDTWNGFLYISNDGSNNVTVINGTTNQVTKWVAAGLEPYDVVFDSWTGLLCVTNELSDSLTLINGSTNQAIGSVGVDSGPMGEAFDSLNGLVYVTNEISNSVTAVDPILGVVSDISVGSEPQGITFDSMNGWLYVTDYGSSKVSVINGSSNEVVGSSGTIPASDATYDPGNGFVYIGSEGVDAVEVLNGSNDQVIGQFAVGSAPVDLGYDPSTGNLYSSNMLSGTLSIISDGIQRYAVEFSESGLPSSIEWSVTLRKEFVSASSTQTIGFVEPNGTYAYRVGFEPGWTTSQFSGFIEVNGKEASQIIAWVRVEYATQFIERGLPMGTNWSILIGSARLFSTTITITTNEPNGTFTFVLGRVSGWTTSAFTGVIQVNGGAYSETIPWTEITYEVTFKGRGLGDGSWWIVVGGISTKSNTDTLSFGEPNGTYEYEVGTSDKTYSSPGGQFTVAGSPETESIVFSRVTSVVTFTQVGLPSTANWSVSFNAVVQTASGDLAFGGVVNGTYSFSVVTLPGFAATPNNGTLNVNGPVTKNIIFRAALNGAGNGPNPPTFLGLPVVEGAGLLAGTIAASVGAAALVIVWYHKSPKPRKPTRRQF